MLVLSVVLKPVPAVGGVSDAGAAAVAVAVAGSSRTSLVVVAL